MLTQTLFSELAAAGTSFPCTIVCTDEDAPNTASGWTDGWMDGWMDEHLSFLPSPAPISLGPVMYEH